LRGWDTVIATPKKIRKKKGKKMGQVKLKGPTCPGAAVMKSSSWGGCFGGVGRNRQKKKKTKKNLKDDPAKVLKALSKERNLEKV